MMASVSVDVVTFVVTRRGGVKQKTANSLRISGLWWCHQDPDARWAEFELRYKKELSANPAFETLKTELADKPKVTLLYSSHDHVHNNAVVVEQLLSA